MYVLGVAEYVTVLLRIDKVLLTTDDFGRSCLGGLATLRVSPNPEEDVRVSLWASSEHADIILPDDDFVLRYAVMEAFCPDDHDNPYRRIPVGIAAVWHDISNGHVLFRIEDLPFGPESLPFNA